MTGARFLIILLIAGVTGVGAYTATVRTRPAASPPPADDTATEALLNWLGASAAQRAELRTHDATFATELKGLRTDLEAKRSEFVATLERADAPDEQIMERLEAVLAANNALERRVVRYLLSVRQHLTPEQQRKLFSLCAEEARHGRRYRGGRDEGQIRTQDDQGQGRGWRGGRGRRRQQ